MRVLLIGSGGREHAIADTLRREAPSLDLLATPGNPGLATIGRTVPSVSDPDALVALARAEAVDVTIVGPEAPLAAGLVDRFRAAGLRVFGPTAAAAQLEASKAFAKDVMRTAQVPTARAETFRDAAHALEAVRTRFGAPVVIKASGLAAGKGVIVCATRDAAEDAIRRIADDRVFGEAGRELLVEEFMTGEELSLFVVTDGTRALPMLAAQDHKRVGAGDTGPNTGGMGAYAPVSLATAALIDDVMARIVEPTLHAMRTRGTPFTGLLYVGLMLTPEGPRVVEFNCRFGDPETQAVLPMLASSLLEPVLRVARGESLAGVAPFSWRDGAAVTTVVAAAGYPETPRTGAAITLPDSTDAVRVFHAGTRWGDDGVLVSAGGRVVAVTALGADFATAQQASRAAAAQVRFEGAFFRHDIGWREAARLAGARHD
ncbi:MAG: phosphoribosylamine--glycine ligase [Burkholderiales bacterium]|nr:phosphoribosylamine--glycine ligase [Gemmatimonadaceae bacterium]MCU0870160.1 phosphoribosylamine--glycine ligase [Burkholderiales bacterium]